MSSCTVLSVVFSTLWLFMSAQFVFVFVFPLLTVVYFISFLVSVNLSPQFMSMSVEDKKTLRIMENSAEKVSGNYQVPLPWKQQPPYFLNLVTFLGSPFHIVLSQLLLIIQPLQTFTWLCWCIANWIRVICMICQ